MKENVLDILMYLLEHCAEEDAQALTDTAALRNHLDYAGFQHHDINKAFAWLEGLAEAREQAVHHNDSAIRIFTPMETRKLDTACRGFLIFLEQTGVLNPLSRELVIDRVMALDGGEIDLIHLKWVVLMVLFNQPGHEAAYAWMEDLLFEQISDQIH